MLLCGKNKNGELGLGDTLDRKAITEESVLFGSGNTALAASSLQAIAYGACHSLSLRGGTVFATGRNEAGQLGLTDTNDRVTQTAVFANLDGKAVTAISCGEHFSGALTDNGELYLFGRNTNGQLGDGTTIDRSTPTLVGGGHHFIAFALGAHHCIAVNRFPPRICLGCRSRRTTRFGEFDNCKPVGSNRGQVSQRQKDCCCLALYGISRWPHARPAVH